MLIITTFITPEVVGNTRVLPEFRSIYTGRKYPEVVLCLPQNPCAAAPLSAAKKQQGFPDPAADLIYFINKLASHSLGHLLDGPLWEGAPAKRVGERA